MAWLLATTGLYWRQWPMLVEWYGLGAAIVSAVLWHRSSARWLALGASVLLPVHQLTIYILNVVSLAVHQPLWILQWQEVYPASLSLFGLLSLWAVWRLVLDEVLRSRDSADEAGTTWLAPAAEPPAANSLPRPAWPWLVVALLAPVLSLILDSIATLWSDEKMYHTGWAIGPFGCLNLIYILFGLGICWLILSRNPVRRLLGCGAALGCVYLYLSLWINTDQYPQPMVWIEGRLQGNVWSPNAPLMLVIRGIACALVVFIAVAAWEVCRQTLRHPLAARGAPAGDDDPLHPAVEDGKWDTSVREK